MLSRISFHSRNAQLAPKREAINNIFNNMAAQITENDLAQYRNVVDQNNKPIIRVPKEVKPLLAAIGWILGKVDPPFVPLLSESTKITGEEEKNSVKKKNLGGGSGKMISILHSIGKDDWELSRKDLVSFNGAKEGERLDSTKGKVGF